MQITKKSLSPTRLQLTIVADEDLLNQTKEQTLKQLSKTHGNLQGFRKGKVPLALLEKSLDQSLLQTEFLENAINRLYVDAARQENLRPVAQPSVEITKFVPFTTLEFQAEVEVVGEIKLGDYKKVKLAKPEVKVTDKDVEDVLSNLTTRAAEKKDVDRAAKDTDQVWIDFTGVDAKTKEPVKGADGKDYPLVLGSKTFIPGFEDELVGLKPGEEKEFTITFPKDYGVKDLQNRKVTFKTTVTKVQEVVPPKIDDAFAASVGPFKNVAELKADIKKQLAAEKQQQADREYESELVTKISEQSEVAIPDALIEEETERLTQQERQNSMYRGQTWEEYLAASGLTEESYKEQARAAAEARAKAGLVLSEIADKENIQIKPEELDVRVQILKGQYQDEKMQAELDKPENRRDIAARMMTEKTLDLLTGLASAKPAKKATKTEDKK